MGIRVLFEDHAVEHYNEGLTAGLVGLGCEVRRVGLRPPLFGVVRTNQDLARLLRLARDYDIVHLNNAFHLDAISLLTLSGKKIVITHHGGGVHSAMGGKERAFWALRLRSLKAEHIAGIPLATISRFASSSIRSQVGVSPTVVYHGVERGWFSAPQNRGGARLRLGIPEHRTVAVWVGRGTAYKDPATLLRTAIRLRESNPEVFFVMKLWHSRPTDLDINSFVKRHELEDTVRLVYDIPYESVPELYGMADLFVHTSPFEGFGLVVLEAMASGLPAVVANVGGPSEYVGEGGIKFAAGDDAQLAGIVASLSADQDERKRLGKAATMIASRFTWKRAAEAYLQIYERALKQ
ncbi:MAG TPA: glycosyltransferase family 4 protein [Nitrososphaerales archaeon]|nr:glycosyltransferase family 4 protein [Nitrososphaerales archaeon]